MNTDTMMAFAERVLTDSAAASAIQLAYLGDELGLWEALANGGPLTAAELAERTGYDERYVTEWLAGCTVATYLTHDPATGRFTLPPEHAAVLADAGSPVYSAGGLEVTAARWLSSDRIAAAVRTGEGVGWHEHDDRLFGGVERFFAPLYRESLVNQWLPAMDGVVQRLQAGARVVDVGCGHGASTILLAEAYPRSRFVGIDPHPASIAAARAAAAKAGVDDRVTFEVGDATGYPADGWDVIAFFDALHDMGDPVGAVRHARSALAGGGTVLVVEPAATDDLADSIGNPVSQLYYAASLYLCVPNSKSQDVGRGLGAQAGPSRLLEVLREGGFGGPRVALATPFNLVLEAHKE